MDEVLAQYWTTLDGRPLNQGLGNENDPSYQENLKIRLDREEQEETIRKLAEEIKALKHSTVQVQMELNTATSNLEAANLILSKFQQAQARQSRNRSSSGQSRTRGGGSHLDNRSAWLPRTNNAFTGGSFSSNEVPSQGGGAGFRSPAMQNNGQSQGHKMAVRPPNNDWKQQ